MLLLFNYHYIMTKLTISALKLRLLIKHFHWSETCLVSKYGTTLLWRMSSPIKTKSHTNCMNTLNAKWLFITTKSGIAVIKTRSVKGRINSGNRFRCKELTNRNISRIFNGPDSIWLQSIFSTFFNDKCVTNKFEILQ